VELTGYLSIARRWWWTLIVATWVAGLSGYLAASQIPPTYEARTELLVGPTNADIDTLRASSLLVQTYAALTTSKPRLQAAIADLGLDLSANALNQATRATANDVERTLTIRVQDHDPATAAKLANQLAAQLIELGAQGTARPEGQVQVTTFAEPPSDPVAPQVSLIVLLAAMAGFLGALVIVILVEYLSGTVRTGDDIARLAAGAPFLGSLEGRFTPPAAGLIVEQAPASRTASSFRVLATKIHLAERERPVRSIVVTGVQPGDRAGEIAANLAAVLSTAGYSVAFVDADPADPDATSRLGPLNGPGFGDLLVGRVSEVNETLVGHSAQLAVIPAGSPVDVELLDTDAARSILEQLTERGARLVVVAAPPVLGSASALVWARVTDATILFARRDHTKRDALTAAMESLRLVDARVVGTVLDDRRRGRSEAGRSSNQGGRLRTEPSRRPSVDTAGDTLRTAALPVEADPTTSARRSPRRTSTPNPGGRGGQRLQATPRVRSQGGARLPHEGQG
jgi:Mrp family chromosome partitioning ATPase/capsular polysaccharide biosynthesis protein